MPRRMVLASLGLLLAAAMPAGAQDAPPGPPPVLVISREEIKPGSMGSHEKQVASYLALFNRANVAGYRLGLVPVFADDNEVVYLEGYPSFAEVESTRKKMDETMTANAAYQAELDNLDRQTGPLHASQKTSVAVYREDLSYHPLKMDEVAHARYFTVTTTRVKFGRVPDYVAYTKQYNAGREKAKLDEHSAVYQVISGAPSNTFVTFGSVRSLTEWDTFSGNLSARTKALDEALGGDTVVKERAEKAAQILADSWSGLYSLNPKISRPAPQFAAYDPAFWNPKAAPAKELAARKQPARKEPAKK